MISTIGGNVMECSGGLRGLKYGITRDYVIGLEAVLMGGRVLRVGGKLTKDVAGYDLVRLLVGSEGTLAVLTEITLKLLPAPEAKATGAASSRGHLVAPSVAIWPLAHQRLSSSAGHFQASQDHHQPSPRMA